MIRMKLFVYIFIFLVSTEETICFSISN